MHAPAMHRTRGVLKQRPEDFIVDEIPAYEPSGEGTHLYVRIRKRNRTTDDVVRSIAKQLGIERRDIGVAGLKDKVGVTTQWLSLPVKEIPAALDGVEVLAQRFHGNKLKTGHLKGNQFEIVVRGIDPAAVAEVETALERIRRDGVPNAFGQQRFGRDGDNVARARAWLTGQARAPRDPRQRRFDFSALQSAIFNAVLDERVREGTWNLPILGDLLKKEETGGIFVCTDVQLDRERAIAGELCPTGPILGDRMRQPEADALELEQRVAAAFIEGIDLGRTRALGEGTRRGLKLRVGELRWEIASSIDEPFSSEDRLEGCAMRLRFVLPKGAYATTVLGNVFAFEEPPRPGGDLEDAPEQQEEPKE